MRAKILPACLLLFGCAALAQTAGQSEPSRNQARADAYALAVSRPLTLEDALEIAEATAETLQIAKAGVTRAEADTLRAKSERLPQLSTGLSYDRTIRSEFSGLFNQSSATPCAPLNVDPNAPPTQQIAELERFIRCGGASSFGASTNLGELPFGRENVYRANLAFSQSLFSGGRISGQIESARTGRETALVNVDTAAAQLKLDVVQAYFNAVLSESLASIAEAALKQAEDTLEQVRVARSVGAQPEFELLRAQVNRDNQRPLLIRRQSDREIAYTRLKQLLDLPQDAPLQLGTRLDDPTLALPAEFGNATGIPDIADLNQRRAPVRQAELQIRQRETAVRIARSQRLPSVSFNSFFSPVAYPQVFPNFGDFRTNWTLGLTVQLPVLTGGRIQAEEMAARAQVDEARARLQQIREQADLDTRTSLEQLRAARATWEASAGTVEQAARAYQIAEVRYREGISTQLELTDSRLLLQQAQVNRAQAARDLQVARARIALLPNLPLAGFAPGGETQQQFEGSAATATPDATTTRQQPASTRQGQGFPTGATGQTGFNR